MERVDALHELLLANWLNYPGLAMQYGQEALEISQENNDQYAISKSLRLIAGVHYYKGDYETCLEYNLKALDMALKLQDSSLINNGYNNVGLVYYNLGSYQTSLEYLLRAYYMKLKIGEEYGLSTTLNNLGLVQERIGDFEEARSHFEEALEVASRNGEQDQIVYSKNNIGNTYLQQDKIDEAIGYFREALKLARDVKNTNWGSVSLRRIGQVKELRGDYDSATYYYHESLKASRQIEDRPGISEVYYLFAKLALKQGELKAARICLDSSNSKANDIRLRQQLLDNLRLYTEVYATANDYQKVIEYQEKYIKLSDSLYQDVVTRNLNLIPAQLKEERDRLELIRQQSILQQKSNTYGVALLIGIPLLVWLVVLLRINQKKNKTLIDRNEEIVRTQKLLVTSEKMASLGLLSAGIGHEINNPLNFIKNGTQSLQKAMDREGLKPEYYQPYFNAIDEGVNRATAIVRSLSHFSRVGRNMDETCDIHDIIENCLIILSVKTRGKAVIKKNFVDDLPSIKGNEGRLHQAFLNVLSNAEQAIESNGVIGITTRKISDRIEVVVTDNGVGIAAEFIEKIGDPFYTTKSPGEGTGLGLFITYTIIEEHNGQIEIDSNLNEGTTVTLSLPIKN